MQRSGTGAYSGFIGACCRLSDVCPEQSYSTLPRRITMPDTPVLLVWAGNFALQPNAHQLLAGMDLYTFP